MSKRPADGGGGGGSGKRRFFQGPGAAAYELGPGLRGVLITCDVHVEKEAIRETFQLFEAFADEPPPPAAPAAAGTATPATAATAGDALAAELAALQGEQAADGGDGGKPSRQRRFAVAQTGCAGTVFIRFNDRALDPVALVDRIMDEACANGPCSAPHVIRMLPVQTSCSARTVEALAEAATPLVRAALCGHAGSYAVHWRRRYNAEIDKMKVIDAMAALVQAEAPQASVDLRAAEAAVCVEVIKTTGCVSVLPRWREFEQYNFRACTEKTGTGAGAGKGNGTAAPKNAAVVAAAAAE